MSSVHFKVNCGYARVAIWQFSVVGRGKRFSELNSAERDKKFKSLFEPMSSYGIDKQILKGVVIENPHLIAIVSQSMVCSKSGSIVTLSNNIYGSSLQRIGRNCQQQVDDVTLFPIARNAQLLISPCKKASQGLHSHLLSP